MDQAAKHALVAYLRAAMEKTGKDATNLARAIGVVPSTITRPLEPSWEGGMSAATLRKVSDYAGLPIPDALQGAPKKPYPAGADNPLSEASAAVYNPRGRDLIPVRSAGRGGEEQEMFLADGPVDYVPRPHVLRMVKEAYALYMVGDSMSPRYEPGFTLYVNPFKPPRLGNGVVIYKTNNAVLVKLFKSHSPTELIVEQLNPRRDMRIPNDQIAQVHRIVSADEV